jgi:hypothetical protein
MDGEKPRRVIDFFLLLWQCIPTDCTVGVAQVVERQTVDLGAVGSSPITHPTAAPDFGFGRRPKGLLAFVAQLDRATDFESVGRRFDSCRTHGA